MSSLTKMLAILDLFPIERPILTLDEIVDALGSSPPTVYRYLRELASAGLIVRYAQGFALGPRAVELDYIIRNSSPLLRASDQILGELRERHGCDLQLLEMMGDRILCVHHVSGARAVTVSFRRGRSMPLLRGSGSKAIMSRLPAARVGKLLSAHPEDLANSAIGHSVPEVLAELQRVRRARVSLSDGELDPETAGAAAPIVGKGSGVSSVVMVFARRQFALMDQDRVAGIVQDAAARIEARLDEIAQSGATSDPFALPVGGSAVRPPRKRATR
jgi:DNA-binding IclR family transcriptional regulator